jgi:hypothetical protein
MVLLLPHDRIKSEREESDYKQMRRRKRILTTAGPAIDVIAIKLCNYVYSLIIHRSKLTIVSIDCLAPGWSHCTCILHRTIPLSMYCVQCRGLYMAASL